MELDYKTRRQFSSVEIAGWAGISHSRVLGKILTVIGYGPEVARHFRPTTCRISEHVTRPMYLVDLGGLVHLSAELLYRSRRDGARRRKVSEFQEWFATECGRFGGLPGEPIPSGGGLPATRPLAVVVPFPVKDDSPPEVG